ncbi:hypothetical protein SAMN04488095_1110 [Jannaschia pohangensis]|uniref:Uncharacterized protein n=1 Tax=Jannaschia pohangensis TaxID=390807 RepID=A0A1I3IV65_9RHOB|nr:hypothetical protein SAMN04488095_1110 [Jannaschia pohangensis]
MVCVAGGAGKGNGPFEDFGQSVEPSFGDGTHQGILVWKVAVGRARRNPKIAGGLAHGKLGERTTISGSNRIGNKGFLEISVVMGVAVFSLVHGVVVISVYMRRKAA